MNDFLGSLDERVPGLLEQYNVPGLALALIEEGRPAAFRRYGFANSESLEPLAPRALFKAASISKSLTAWGIMVLVERGLVDLDAPVSRYLRRWSLPGSPFSTEKVTPRLLLSHRAGTTLSGCSASLYTDPRPTLLDALRGQMPPVDQSQLDYIRLWNVPPEAFNVPVTLFQEPGTGYRYSGGGFMILELLIEDVTGLGFAEFMAREVLLPLGMADSSFEPAALDGFATPHDTDGKPIPHYRTNGLAAGGLACSIEDLATFACAGVEGPEGEAPGRGVISPASVAAMHTGQGFSESVNGIDYQAALGHMVGEIHGLRFAMHTGGNHGWRSVFNIVPERRRGIAQLVNGAGGNPVWIEIMGMWRASLVH
jgi:CubicO group peptidase (beta-lactamase class C family)